MKTTQRGTAGSRHSTTKVSKIRLCGISLRGYSIRHNCVIYTVSVCTCVRRPLYAMYDVRTQVKTVQLHMISYALQTEAVVAQLSGLTRCKNEVDEVDSGRVYCTLYDLMFKSRKKK